MPRWNTFTPDGRRLSVDREANRWIVACGDQESVQRELLDVALIEALRKDVELTSGSTRLDYARWTRELADRIQREAEFDDERSRRVLPSKGDRIELLKRRFGITVRGTVQYVDQLQILVKWDDGQSSNLRVGVDWFRMVE